MGAPLPQGDIIRFPYAVAEIKLQSEPPAWVEGLLQTGERHSSFHSSCYGSWITLPQWMRACMHTLPAVAPTHNSAGMLLPVPKFSKFLHGTALLFQPRCTNMPYWFLPGG